MSSNAEEQIVVCEYFNSTTCVGEDTNYCLRNYEICEFRACGGNEVIISTVRGTDAYCIGDTYVKLFDENDLLGLNDDYDWNNNCSEILFSIPYNYKCKNYNVHIGCYGDKACEAQVVINITSTRPLFVTDVVNNVTGEAWTLNCPEYTLLSSINDQNTTFDYGASLTSVCSFEVCPWQFYEVSMNCSDSSVSKLFSYGDKMSDEDLIASVTCGNSVFFNGFGSNSIGKCRLVSIYQTCQADNNESGSCSGQTSVTASSYPQAHVEWIDALLASPGYPLRYRVSDYDMQDASYKSSNSYDLYLGVYKSDMLANQEFCNYISFDDSTDKPNFYDFINYTLWDGNSKTDYVSTSNSQDYIVSEFGGSYKMMVFLWKKSLKDINEVFVLATTQETLRVPATASLKISITNAFAGDFINGSWKFTKALSRVGDRLVLYEVNTQGNCNFQHKRQDYDSALWNFDIQAGRRESSDFSTASTQDSVTPFRLPNIDLNVCSKSQQYEVRYIRDNEVLSRSLITPIVKSMQPSGTPTFSVERESHGASNHGLEYSIVIVIIIVGIFSTLSYVFFKGQKKKHVTNGQAYEDTGSDDGLQEINFSKRTGNPLSSFQIELSDDEDDDRNSSKAF